MAFYTKQAGGQMGPNTVLNWNKFHHTFCTTKRVDISERWQIKSSVSMMSKMVPSKCLDRFF